jgi:hypothetical protein
VEVLHEERLADARAGGGVEALRVQVPESVSFEQQIEQPAVR